MSEVWRRVGEALEDKKAKDLVILDVEGRSLLADRVILASGTSTTHVNALAEGAIQRLKEDGVTIFGIEGQQEAKWVLIDAGTVIVHIMTEAMREFYALERLYPDAPHLSLN